MSETGKTYDSNHDSGDDYFEEGAELNTVATVPLSSPSQHGKGQQVHITQDTLAVDSPINLAHTRSPKIQVAASSPLQHHDRGLSTQSLYRGDLVHMMAPPGTMFRPPTMHTSQQQSQQSHQLNLSDEDDPARVIDSSSDDETARRTADMKPSVFMRGDKPISNERHTIQGSPHSNRFAQFSYPTTQKRTSDVLADAYGSTRHGRPAKMQKQSAPAKPILENAMTLADIPDFHFREHVKNLRIVYPHTSVLDCYTALKRRKGNYADASELIAVEYAAKDEAAKRAIDLTSSDVEEIKPSRKLPLTKSNAALSSRRQVETTQTINDKYSSKRQVDPPKTIAEKWSKTQATPLVPTPQAQMLPNSSTTKQSLPINQPVRRRLVQGRKGTAQNLSPKVLPQPRLSAPTHRERAAIIVSDDEDSGLATESEPGDADDAPSTSNVLNFINTCTKEDLLDTTNAASEVLGLILSHRPFPSITAIRQLSIESTTTTKAGKVSTKKKNVGERFVDVCEEMLTGYTAIDALVGQCEALGKPVTMEMKAWGFNAFGGRDGELELVDIEAGSHDSGIGTPTSSTGDDLSRQLLRQPKCMSEELVMKDYQITGLNWLALLFSRKLSCILADDMGLGKTCQVIAFISHLVETGISKGRHLVIVPGSTLENWLREFQTFSPGLRVEPYYGSQAERQEAQEAIESEIEQINVIVTTYDMAWKKDDAKFLRHLKPVVCVYDEGHALKNSQSKRYQALMRIPAEFRLLLTGTPLQNNLQELIALLAFIMPSIFTEKQEHLEYIFKHKAKTTESDHSALLSDTRIKRARSMMTPFILRRKKHQVLQHLPRKTHKVEFCNMTDAQQAIYTGIASRMTPDMLVVEKAERSKSSTSANILMELRKAAIHPLLFRRFFTDTILRRMAKACLHEPEFATSDAQLIFEDMQVMNDFELQRFCLKYPTLYSFAWHDDKHMQAGKVAALQELLLGYQAAGHRALVFSQFTMVLDILEQVLSTLALAYVRLDGQTRMQERQDVIDLFQRDAGIPVFLLSTKAGGAGINLTGADRVVVFDTGFNPQEEVQAENRAHRVGQMREVEVVRLVARGSVEEQILALGRSKLALDERVAGEVGAVGEGASGEELAAAERRGEDMVRRMMLERIASESKDGTIQGGKDHGGELKTEEAELLRDKTDMSTDEKPAKRAPHDAKAVQTADLRDRYAADLQAAGVDVPLPTRRRTRRK